MKKLLIIPFFLVCAGCMTKYSSSDRFNILDILPKKEECKCQEENIHFGPGPGDTEMNFGPGPQDEVNILPVDPTPEREEEKSTSWWR